ncbi:hypothetical protein NPIL_112111 [Nephila pilipes]|uniref:Uncharacterized protein n=1 Tax=Nephila pilipes TaxID=299642 RepID=A0A8X6NXE4_NEPPI|nr:hypothetical protein NPIL_112111 [Nephila pilipes]
MVGLIFPPPVLLPHYRGRYSTARINQEDGYEGHRWVASCNPDRIRRSKRRLNSFLCCRTNFRSPLTVASEGMLRGCERSLHWAGRQPFAEERTNPSSPGDSPIKLHCIPYNTPCHTPPTDP